MRLRSVHVLLVGLPGVLQDIVREVLSDQPDIVVEGTVRDPKDLHEALDRTGADLVIWGVPGIDTFDGHTSLFDRHPGIKVIVIHHDGRQGVLWQLRPHRTSLGEVSPPRLLQAIRATIRH